MTGIATSASPGLFIACCAVKIQASIHTIVLSITLVSSACGEESGRPSAGFIPTRSLALPSRPNRKRSSSRSFRRAAACSAGASVTPPITPAWLQSPEHLRRPGDFRSYCHAPARLWPPEPSTDSLDLTHKRPARGARLFQTGALPAHRCPVKPGITGKRSR